MASIRSYICSAFGLVLLVVSGCLVTAARAVDGVSELSGQSFGDSRSPAVRYVFFHIAQTHPLGWQQGNPDSFTRFLFDDFLEKLEPVEHSTLMAGFSYTFSVLRHPPATLVASLERLLALSEETGVPVQINVDGQNWWGERPDLWNWWDPAAPGYDPENRLNVEWTDWDPESAVRIGWRNWGTQLRVPPEPNLLSPAFLEAVIAGVRPLAATVAAWHEDLPDNRKYLLGGFRVGWETSIGVNAFYYPNGNDLLNQDPANDPTYGRDHGQGLFAGLPPLGHAAVRFGRIKNTGEITRADIAEVVFRHLAILSEAASEEGIPRDLLFTHQGGTYEPWEQHLPFWPAMNEWSTPGWSFYNVDPRWPAELDQAMHDDGRDAWAAVEWLWSGGQNTDVWRSNFERTLNWRNCRFLTVYNWNPYIMDTADGQAARTAVRAMMEDRVELPALEQWRREYFDDPDSDEAGLLADPNGDGVVNLVKFALRGNPHADDRTVILPVLDRDAGSGTVSFVFRVRRDGAFTDDGRYRADGVLYSVETAGDLGEAGWEAFSLVPETAEIADSGSGLALVVTVESGPRELFFRLRVTAEDP